MIICFVFVIFIDIRRVSNRPQLHPFCPLPKVGSIAVAQVLFSFMGKTATDSRGPFRPSRAGTRVASGVSEPNSPSS
jgi:hypothetical protein